MDYRRPGSPFPFASYVVQADASLLTTGEQEEVYYLLNQVTRAVAAAQRKLENGKGRRGEIAKLASSARYSLERIERELMNTYAEQHPEEAAGEKAQG